MRRLIIVLMAALIVFLPSCRNQPDIEYPLYNSDTWDSAFDAYWNNMNKNYIMFDLDYSGSQWDDIYDYYHPLFEELGDIGEDESETEIACRYFFDISTNIIDGHYSLRFKIDDNNSFSFGAHNYRILSESGLSDDDIFALFMGRLSSSDIKPNLLGENLNTILRYTFGFTGEEQSGFVEDDIILGERVFDGFYVEEESEEGSLTALLGLIDSKIAYFGFSDFEFYPYLHSEDENDVKRIYYELERLLNDESVEGIIIDLRGNGGGRNNDLDSLWGLFTSVNVAYEEMRIKDGPNRGDFSAWQTGYIQGERREGNYDKPVAILFNRNSLSCAELTVMIFNAFKSDLGMNVRTFGNSNTGGGTCSLYYDDIVLNEATIHVPRFNAGCFSILPNMISVYTPNQLGRGIDGVFYEGVGFTPDEYIPFDDEYLESFRAGSDLLLSSALDWIETL